MHGHHKPTPPPMQDPGSGPAPKLFAPDALQERIGAIAISTWFLGGWVVLFVLMLLGIGPVVWISGWLNRSTGSDSPILAFAIAFGVVSLPVVALQLMPWQGGSPFLRGAQRALRPNHDPNFRIGPPRAEQMSAALLRMIKIIACLAAISLIGGTAGFRLMTRTSADAGKPLPALSPQQIIERQDHLPRYVTLTTLAPGFPPNWLHLWSIRQTRYADLYFPIHPTDGRADSPTWLIGRIHYLGDGPGSNAVLEVPIDGKLEVATLPAWMRQLMAQRGFVVADHVIMFTPNDDLHGRFPGPDRIGAGFVLFLGTGLAVVLAIIGSILALRRHRLINAAATTPGHRQPALARRQPRPGKFE